MSLKDVPPPLLFGQLQVFDEFTVKELFHCA
jgi:hypothetical protein